MNADLSGTDLLVKYVVSGGVDPGQREEVRSADDDMLEVIPGGRGGLLDARFCDAEG